MRAVVFDLSIPKYLLATALGKQLPSLYYGRGSCLRLDEVPKPALRGPAWARVAVERAGICGTDISTIFFKLAPSLSPFSSFPCVLGHEILGRIDQLGDEARAAGFREGDRVSVNPFFGCVVRDEPLCPACARGDNCTCHRAGCTSDTKSGALAPGTAIGFHRDLPGGWGESMIAHVSQLVRVPDAMPDARAVMLEPLAIGVHAALRRLPREGEKTLVIGGGIIAWATLAALRALGCKGHVTVLTLLEYQAEIARRLGADEVIRPAAGDGALLDEVCRITGARRNKPVLGGDVLSGGFDVIFDCIGSPQSVRDSLRFVASQGAVVMVGAAGEVPKTDLTPVWNREIAWIGTVGYAPEPSRGGRHTFDLTRELYAGPEGAPLDALVTHTFPLDRYQEAIRANVERGASRSVKVVFKTEN